MVALAVALETMFAFSEARAEIRIGVAAPLTGPDAWNGEQTRAGADQAVQDLSDRGGVLVGSEDFALIAGGAAEGIPMTYHMAAVRHPAAAAVVRS